MRKKNFCIVGDGQLARYLCQSAKKMEMNAIILGRKESSAAKYADEIVSDLNNLDNNNCFVTFENEFLDLRTLKPQIEKYNLNCHPDTSVIEELRDKLKQKKFLDKISVASAPYLVWGKEKIETFLFNTTRQFPETAILKWSTGGYDSKGVFFFSPGVTMQEAAEFCVNARINGAQIYAEDYVNFTHEVAQVSSRDEFGNFHHLPLVKTWQQDGICRLVQSLKSSEARIKEAKAICEEVMSYWDYVGVLCVEMFLSKEGKLLVNEIAPRVHNSGHFSLSASEYSQFDMHVAAVCGKQLATNKHTPYFAMWNIIVPQIDEAFVLSSLVDENEIISEGIELFWYDKTVLKTKRKMGHLVAVAETKAELDERIQVMKIWEQKLWQKILNQ